MKKLFTLVLALFLVTSFGFYGYAKGKPVVIAKGKPVIVKVKENPAVIKKSMQSISPKKTTTSAVEFKTQLENVVKAFENNSKLTKQLISEKITVAKLIDQMNKNKQRLTTVQYDSVNGLLAAINAENKKITEIKGIGVLQGYIKSKNIKTLGHITVEELTKMLNGLNQNAVYLNNNIKSYDSIIAILKTAATTTPGAITVTPGAITTTGSAITTISAITTSSAITN